MLNLGFLTPQIDVRGTCVAIFDYAKSYKDLYRSNIFIFYFSDKNNDINVLENKFKKEFGDNNCIGIDSSDIIQLNLTCIELNIDIMYFIKYGKNDKIFTRSVPSIIHCVFDMSEPHGDVYIGVSKYVAEKYNYKKQELKYLEHMISLTPSSTKTNMREELGIPSSAKVFGRYGGMDTFNVDFVIEAIREILQQDNNIYFLFCNTPKFFDSPRVKYIDTIITEEEKNKFIHTCDYHLECGTLGHSFGLACGEFSVNNKPIILYYNDNLFNKAHIDIIKEKGLYFTNKEEFKNLIENHTIDKSIDYNCYRKYNRKNITDQFHVKCILPILLKKYDGLI